MNDGDSELENAYMPKGSGTGDISGLPALPTRTNFAYYIKTKSSDPFGLDNKLPQSRGQTLGYE